MMCPFFILKIVWIISLHYPTVVLHPQEPYLPSSVASFIEQTTLTCDDQILPGSTIIKDSNSYENCHLHSNSALVGTLETNHMYVNFQSNHEVIQIQYWIFYPYNGPLMGFGEHHGDWEYIIVELNHNLEVQRLFCSVHAKEGQWYLPKDVNVHNGHFIVYAAKHSHAHYISIGKKKRKQKILFVKLPPDFTNDSQKQIKDPKLHLIAIQEHVNYDSFPWLRFAGKWGNTKMKPWQAKGPLGPTFQSSWNVIKN